MQSPSEKSVKPGLLGSARLGCSPKVDSPQSGPHKNLEHVVQRHLDTAWRAPPPRHTVEAFERACSLLGGNERDRVIFDSGCGTGASVERLARMHTDCIVIGIDRSASRLASALGADLARRRGNVLWVRAELAAFWRLAVNQGWRLRKHYLLYPNPWPKPGHLARRWHGHPAFPVLLDLGGEIELRCNWRIYAEEFGRAMAIAVGKQPAIECFQPEQPLTPFEAKYLASGHALYRLRVRSRKSPGCPGLSKATKVHSS